MCRLYIYVSEYYISLAYWVCTIVSYLHSTVKTHARDYFCEVAGLGFFLKMVSGVSNQRLLSVLSSNSKNACGKSKQECCCI